ncbi:MAG: 4-(cytidine 5'-diphospho)-2-C-methyl-D-erythritol kinase [Pseudomonadota bacterium]
MTDGTLTGFAPAKVNLTLHLKGRRADGYHLMSSLVVFPEIGDHLTARADNALRLTVSGPFAQDLDGDNLILTAAERLSVRHGVAAGAALHLVKNLPVASGIGGGSTDCAAALRLLSRLWQVKPPADLALSLGADVPVCTMAPEPQIMEGIGEILSPAPALPTCAMVLVNPGIGVSTQQIFARVDDPCPPDGPEMPGTFASFVDLAAWLRRTRNDLEAPARDLAPAIGAVLDALSPAAISRMSGSGATCWALFPNMAEAEALARTVRSRAPDWWVEAAWVRRP